MIGNGSGEVANPKTPRAKGDMSRDVRTYHEMSKVVNGNNSVEISVSYRKGGINMWNGNMERQGIEVYVNPVKRETRNGIVSTSFMMFSGSGFRVLVQELPRFNQKKLDKAVETLEPIKGQIVEFMEKEDKQGAANLIMETFRKVA